jgi:H+/Cl- antiporter ClcA
MGRRISGRTVHRRAPARHRASVHELRRDLTALNIVLEFVATWLSTWCGTPGGLLAPSLSIDTGIGDFITQIAQPGLGSSLVALGMATFLSAVTETSLTAAVIVMEMLEAGELILALVPFTLIVSALSRSISQPLYATIATRLLRPLGAPIRALGIV